MKEQFVPYEIGLKLKEKGFDEECLMCFYGDNKYGQPKDKLFIPSAFGKAKNSIKGHDESGEWLTAPLWQQVLTWLRDVHNIDINIDPGGLPKMYAVFVKNWIYENEKDRALFTYEDAQEQAILKALELI